MPLTIDLSFKTIEQNKIIILNKGGVSMVKNITTLVALSLIMLLPAHAGAEMLEASGNGEVNISSDINATRTAATRKAKRAAVEELLRKLIGPNAPNDPKVQEAMDKIVVQIDDKKNVIKGTKTSESTYEVSYIIKIDEQRFREFLDNQGIATTYDQGKKILIVMEEFFTTPTDKNKPLSEVFEYSHDKTATSEASLSAAQSSSSDTRAAARESSAASAKYAAGGSSSGYSSGGYSNGYGGGGYSSGGRSSGYASGSAAAKSKSSAEYSNQSADAARLDTKSYDQKKDVVSIKKSVQYQPQNTGAEDSNLTYAALVEVAMKYDLELMDNSTLRSKFFTGKPLSIKEMENSQMLSRYVDFARDNGAEYFMVGNSVIRDIGNNECEGAVQLKAFSVDDNSILTSAMQTETASGVSTDNCKGLVAKKLAYFVGDRVGASIKAYNRQREAKGKTYTIKLMSALGDLSGRMTSSFSRELGNLKGLNGKLNARGGTAKLYEVTLVYKGEKEFMGALGEIIDRIPSLQKADYTNKGSIVSICLEGPRRCD
jgi:hypothetical protein